MMEKHFCEQCGREITTKNSTHYCKKHFWQLQKYGKFLDSNPRTKYDPNEFRFKENYVEFDTYLSTGDIQVTYKIDTEDYPKVAKHKWFTNKSGYAMTRIKTKIVFLHRLLLNPFPGQQVDHISLDITDNRKSNLRLCNNSLNQANRHPYNSLNVKGVQYHKALNKYSAYFRIEGKQYHSSCYDTIEEAAFARFIIEQSFCNESLTQFNDDYIKKLSQTQKQKIIADIKNKFNL